MWLSEYEKDFEPPHCNVGARKSGRRMARVLRELAEFTKAYKNNEEARRLHASSAIDSGKVWDAFEALSDDAKELLDVR